MSITIPPAALEAGARAFIGYGVDAATTFWSNADGAGCGRYVLSLPLPPQETHND